MDKININTCSLSSSLNDAGLYQLGDHLLGRNGKGEYDIKHYLITDSKFENTILGKLAKRMINKGNDEKERFKNTVEIINEIMKEKDYDLPQQNDIVIHLRLGDVFDLPSDEKYLTEKIPRLEPILKIIKNNKHNNRIVFVTAYSFGPGKFSEGDRVKNGIEKSSQFMSKIIDNIPPNMPHLIKSSESVDEDFIYLVNAKRLIITSKSGFSVAALKINKMFRHKK
jgi:hypothetical protein